MQTWWKQLLLSLVLCCGLTVGPAWAEWKPAQGPLMTRWAKDVSADRVHPEYPRPQLVRNDWLSLNGVWQLGRARGDEASPVGRPLTEEILVPFPVESALSGVLKPANQLCYRRTFTVPPAWQGRRVLLHFGAVDWEATVWVNGEKLGQHRGGFDPFSFDITSALKPNAEQELVVGVTDPTDAGLQPRGKQVNNPGGIFYTPTTGIWQSVWLEPVAPVSIAQLKITPDVPNAQVQIEVQLRGQPAGPVAATARVTSKGQEVARVQGTAGQPLLVRIPEPQLWSPDSPHLYDLDVEVQAGGQTIDRVQSYFGMRSVSVGPDEKGVTRLLLNGKFVFQVGPLDQGFWPDGLYTAPTDEALKYDLEITKKLGFNTTRKHVKVEPDRWYYWCDRLGLLVWQDMPSGDRSVDSGQGEIRRTPESAQQYERELQRMLETLHNHPSIVMWVVFNEGWGQFDTERITRATKARDPSRWVNCASGWNDYPVGDMHDIHVYPGPGSPMPEPRRAAVLGEFGGLGLGVDGHTWAKQTWGYRGAQSSDDLTRKYERLLADSWKLKDAQGLSAVIYTQITDVETEANGLLTYDRAVVKVDADRVRAVNLGDVSKIPQVKPLIPIARDKPATWRFTEARPAGEDWIRGDFDDAGWSSGPSGFGTEKTPGATIGTKWSSADIWIRREFELPATLPSSIVLNVHHDEDCEIYLNGVLAARLSGYIADYEEAPLSEAARQALRPGKNTLAVHCHQTGGGQYIDVGLSEITSAR